MATPFKTATTSILVCGTSSSIGHRWVQLLSKHGQPHPWFGGGTHSFIVDDDLGVASFQVRDNRVAETSVDAKRQAVVSHCFPQHGVECLRFNGALANAVSVMVVLSSRSSSNSSSEWQNLIVALRVALSKRDYAEVIFLVHDPTYVFTADIAALREDFPSTPSRVEQWEQLDESSPFDNALQGAVMFAERAASASRHERSRQPLRLVIERGTMQHKLDAVCRVLTGTLRVEDPLSSPSHPQRLFAMCTIKLLSGHMVTEARADDCVVVRFCAGTELLTPGTLLGPAAIQPSELAMLGSIRPSPSVVSPIFSGVLAVPKGADLRPAERLFISSRAMEKMVQLWSWTLDVPVQDFFPAPVDPSRYDFICFMTRGLSSETVVVDEYVGTRVALVQRSPDRVVSGIIVAAWQQSLFRQATQCAFASLNAARYVLSSPTADVQLAPFMVDFIKGTTPMQRLTQHMLRRRYGDDRAFQRAVLAELAAYVLPPLESVNWKTTSLRRNTACANRLSSMTLLLTTTNVPYPIKLDMLSWIREPVVFDLDNTMWNSGGVALVASTPEMLTVSRVIRPEDITVEMMSGMSIAFSEIAVDTISTTGLPLIVKLLRMRRQPAFFAPAAVDKLHDLYKNGKLPPKLLDSKNPKVLDFFINVAASMQMPLSTGVGLPLWRVALNERGGFHRDIVDSSESDPVAAYIHSVVKVLRCHVRLPTEVVHRIMCFVLQRTMYRCK